MQRLTAYQLFCFGLVSLLDCSNLYAFDESRFDLASVICCTRRAKYQSVPSQRQVPAHVPVQDPGYASAIIVDLNPDPEFTFKPEFVSQSLEVYNIVHRQMKKGGKRITGFVNLSPLKFQMDFKMLLFALDQLGVQRFTVYSRCEDGYKIHKQCIREGHGLRDLSDRYPESYFRVKKDTPNSTSKLEKKPGTSGSISNPE